MFSSVGRVNGGPAARSTTSARSSTDRASDYGSEGWGFESLRAHRNNRAPRVSPRTGSRRSTSSRVQGIRPRPCPRWTAGTSPIARASCALADAAPPALRLHLVADDLAVGRRRLVRRQCVVHQLLCRRHGRNVTGKLDQCAMSLPGRSTPTSPARVIDLCCTVTEISVRITPMSVTTARHAAVPRGSLADRARRNIERRMGELGLSQRRAAARWACPSRPCPTAPVGTSPGA